MKTNRCMLREFKKKKKKIEVTLLHSKLKTFCGKSIWHGSRQVPIHQKPHFFFFLNRMVVLHVRFCHLTLRDTFLRSKRLSPHPVKVKRPLNCHVQYVPPRPPSVNLGLYLTSHVTSLHEILCVLLDCLRRRNLPGKARPPNLLTRNNTPGKSTRAPIRQDDR